MPSPTRRIILNETPQYLLDSNFLVALTDTNDVHHAKALALFEKLGIENPELFLSDICINEVLSVLAKRCEEKKKKEEFARLAMAFQKSLKNYPILCLYELLPKNYSNVFSLMISHEGLLNFHDALIVIFLKEVPRVSLISFDADFHSVAGLSVIPSPRNPL